MPATPCSPRTLEKRGEPPSPTFPCRPTAYVRLALGDALSLYGSLGYRGQARALNEPTGTGAATPIASRFISREHYLMWRPEAMGIYARAGRFFAPFGLRLAEHYAYVRRDLGYNLLEESYNLSLGYLQNAYEVHVTALHAGPRAQRGR